MSQQPKELDVTAFTRAVCASNPFIRDRVTQVSETGADVTSIHKKEFNKLVRRIGEVRKSGDTAGILLVGAPGVGKSHLLARLSRWAKEDGKATVVYLHNLLASPERMARYLLRATVSSLAGYRPSAYAESDLYALINRAIGSRLKKEKAKSALNLNLRKPILESIGAEIDPDQLVMPVFIAFLEQAMGANLAQPEAEARSVAAVQWLAGETIEAELARGIGLRVNTEEGASIPDDEAVQRTLDVICRLCAYAERPFILCLDQVDNLDPEKVTALTSFLHAALDNGHNLVVVLSGVKSSMDELERSHAIPRAALDRLAQHRITLKTISPAEARKIVEERVKLFLAPFLDLKEVAARCKKEPLLPLSSRWLEKRLRDKIEVRPRDIIRWARDAWEVEQENIDALGGERWLKEWSKAVDTVPPPPPPPLDDAIDEVITKKVAEAIAERKLHRERLPPDADNLATLTVTLLGSCKQRAEYTLRSIERVTQRNRPTTYDVLVTEESPKGDRVTNGLTFLTADNAMRSVHALKRITEDPEPPTHQLLITDEERRPLRLGQKGQETYDELTRTSRFLHIPLCFNDYATLDALVSVLGAARAADLEVEHQAGEYRPITEAECLDALHRKDYFLSHPLLRELLTEEPIAVPSPLIFDPITREQIRQRIAGELSWRLGLTAREMAQIVVERAGQPKEQVEPIWHIVKDVAQTLHSERHLFATAQDDDLFLQYRRKEAS